MPHPSPAAAAANAGPDASANVGTNATTSNDEAAALFGALATLFEHKRLVLVLPLCAGALALGLSFLMPLSFTANTKMLPPQQGQGGGLAALMGGGGLAGVLGAAGGLKNPADQWVGMLKSRVIADALIERFKLQTLYENQYRFQTRQALEGNTRITAGKDGLIDIEVTDHSPERAAQMADAYVEELQKLTSLLAVTEAGQRRLVFEHQLGQAKDRLVKAETALKAAGVGSAALKTSPEATVGRLAQLQATVTAQEIKLSVMRSTLTEAAPELQLVLRELAALRVQLRAAEGATPPGHAGNSGVGISGVGISGTGGSDNAEGDYIARYRDFKYAETLYELLARQYELARSDESREGALVQVVDPAQIPEYKSKPKRGLIAVLTSLLCGIAAATFVLTRQALRNYAATPGGHKHLQRLRQAWRGHRQGVPHD